MDSKIEDIDSPAEEAAFLKGLALVEFLNLFVFFLNETPEGARAKKELEKDWKITCERLKEEKELKGQIFSFSQWVKEIQKKLISSSQPSNRKSNKKCIRQKQPQRFKNIS